MKAWTGILVAAMLAAGCSEKPQSIGEYRGKTDAKPYAAAYGGDKGKWEAALRARNQNQNEYKRID